MKITLDDPRLTAYALDELDGAERETIEAELENYDECQREVEEITRTAALLSAELAAEPLPQLTYAQQMAIEAKLQPGASKSESVSPRAALQTQFPVSPLKRLRSRAAIFAAAATVATGICLGVLHFFSGGPGTTAFAQTVQQIQNAKSITWKVTYYEYYASSQEAYREGRKSLRTGNQLYAYKAPGLYRKEDLDDNGQVWLVIITDVVHMRELSLFPKSKTARLSEIASAPYDTQGPFSGYLKELQAVNLQWVETRKTVTSEINIFRRAFNDNVGGRHSYDFWIDAKSKRLVEVHVPGVDLYDPDKDPVRNNPPGYVSFGGESPGYFVHDIAYGAELDQSLFRLEPPAGYTLETVARTFVTETNITDYLSIMAEYNDKTFPEEAFGYWGSAKVNKIYNIPEQDRTPLERKVLDTVEYYIDVVKGDPIGRFIEDSTIGKSFRYLGKGVALGDKDRVVCWYKLKGAQTYRVVYGDLSVKDVSPEDLPLPVEP